MPAIKLALQFKLLNWNNLKNEEIVNWNNDFQDTNEQLNSFINKFVNKNVLKQIILKAKYTELRFT